MVADASNGEPLDATAITFPEFQSTGNDKVVEFYFHMFGEHVGLLTLQVLKQ